VTISVRLKGLSVFVLHERIGGAQNSRQTLDGLAADNVLWVSDDED